MANIYGNSGSVASIAALIGHPWFFFSFNGSGSDASVVDAAAQYAGSEAVVREQTVKVVIEVVLEGQSEASHIYSSCSPARTATAIAILVRAQAR